MLIAILEGMISAECLAQTVLVARSPEGRTAWAVVRERAGGERSGGSFGREAALTEVWVSEQGGEPRRVRGFPGRPDALAWEGDRLVYADHGLTVALIKADSTKAKVEVVLVPGQRWAISLREDEDQPAPGTAGRPTVNEALPEALQAIPGPEVEKGLAAVWAGMNMAMMAYYQAQHGSFKAASVAYEKAGIWYERLPSEAKALRLSNAVCRSYSEALSRRSKVDEQAMGREVCADHLRIIRDFIKGYAGSHGGVYPVSLAELRGWMEKRYGTVGSLFRAPVDQDSSRILSYGYRPPLPGDPDGMPVIWSYFYVGWGVELVKAGDDLAIIDRAFGKAQIDSLFALGVRAMETDSLKAAIQALDEVTYLAPLWPIGHSRLGYAYLKAGNMGRAEAAFLRATGIHNQTPEAHHGLGVIYSKRPNELYTAIHYFMNAIGWDPDYVEARYHLAEARLKLGEFDALREAERVIAIDSTYAPAYALAGRWWEEMQNDTDRAALWYTKYLAMKPGDNEIRARLGGVYQRARDFEKVTKVLMDHVQGHPEDVEALPILANACVEMRRLDWAQTFFKRYLDGIPDSERSYYEDIRLVAYPEETAEYEGAVKSGQREAFLNRFWAKRDPDLVTPINERLLEHYRRVWYARQNFSKRKQPWDRRGEVYIRFGEPEHRSRSNMANFRMSLEAERVKARMAEALYGTTADIGTYFGPVYPIKGGRHYDPAHIARQRMIELTTGIPQDLSGLGVEGDYAATATAQEGTDLAPWESWVYTKIGGGIEIDFTDEMGNEIYEFAPQVLDARVPPDRLRRFGWYAPERLFRQAVAAAPDQYTPRIDAPPLQFYYDIADFRGSKEGWSVLEVYYGIPREAGRYFAEADSTRMVVERAVALVNPETGAAYRSQSELVFEGAGNLTRERGAFVPDIARLEIPPGKYRLEVTARDRMSGRVGRYQQDVGMVDYGKGLLRLSGLELAWQVSEGEEGDKFTRYGLRIVPLPTRTFRKGQNVFVYYEVYNLKPDSSGVTRHGVEYAIRTEAGGFLSKAFPALARQRPAVSVSQAQAGMQEAEYRYIELDPKGVDPGKGTITVTVKDLNSGQAVQREIAFTMVE